MQLNLMIFPLKQYTALQFVSFSKYKQGINFTLAHQQK